MPDVQVSFGANIERLIEGVNGAKEAIGSVKESVDRVSEGAKHLAEMLGVAFTVEGIKSFVESMANLGLHSQARDRCGGFRSRSGKPALR